MASGCWPGSGERDGSYILLWMEDGDGDDEEKERREKKGKEKTKRDFCEVQVSKHAEKMS